MGLRIGPGTWSLLDSGKKGWGCSDAFKESGIPEVLRSVLKACHYEFDVERAIYLTVLHRLFASGSDRAAERWREDYRIPETEGLEGYRSGSLRQRPRRGGALRAPTGLI